MAFAEFTDSDYKFIAKEFGLNRLEVDSLDETGIDELYNQCCSVEIDEAYIACATDDDALSDRGKMAVRLVDLIHGSYDEDDYGEDEEDVAV